MLSFSSFLKIVLFVVCGVLCLLHFLVFPLSIIGRSWVRHELFREVSSSLFLGQARRIVFRISFNDCTDLYVLSSLVGRLIKTLRIQIITTSNHIQITLDIIRERCRNHTKPFIAGIVRCFPFRALFEGRGYHGR